MVLSHENNRIKQRAPNECAMVISPVDPSDNGVWSYNIKFIENQNVTEDNGEIELIVAPKGTHGQHYTKTNKNPLKTNASIVERRNETVANAGGNVELLCQTSKK